MKKLISFILCVLFAISMISPASAATIQSGSCGTNLTWILDNGTLTITGSGAMQDFGWTRSNYPKWSGSEVKKVVISDGVTYIGNYAFVQCKNLTDITLPASVTDMGENVFSGCASLTGFTLPTTMTKIPKNFFSGCTALREFTIHDGITLIGSSAFSRCSSLTELIIPSSVTKIEQNAFNNSTSLKRLAFPAGVDIAINILGGCTGLTDVVISSGTTKLGYMLFSGCSSLRSVTIPASVTLIDEGAFWKCDALTDIYYAGTRAQWSKMTIKSGGNTALDKATIHYSSGAAPSTVKVSFDAKGGTASSASATVNAGSALSSLPTAERAGYSFGGWQLANGTAVTTQTKFSANTTVYAVWTKTSTEAKPAPGTPIGDVRYTKILAYIDGKPIRSYNINDNTHIIVEDLAQFGFEVQWIPEGNGRLIVTGNRTAKPANYTTTYTPDPNSPTSGVAMQHLATNITTYLGSVEVKSYNIGGFTCIWLDELANVFGYGIVWDGVAATLSLNTQS